MICVLTILEAKPELVVVLLLHAGYDLPPVLEGIGLLDGGHEVGLNTLPTGAVNQLTLRKAIKVHGYIPG